MLIRITRCATILVAVSFFACSEESPFLSENEAKKIIKEANLARDPFHAIKDVVAIINNDIYYFARLDSIPKRLTSTPSQIKTHVKLSADKTQIAYLNSVGTPVIVNAANGTLIKTLTEFSYVRQIDWAKDKKSLYILSDNKIHTSGVALTVTQPQTNHPWDEVVSFSMNSKGDYGYFIKYYGNYYHTLEYVSSTKSLDKQFTNFDGDFYDYIDFYDNNGNFLVAYSDYYGEGFSRVICIQDYNMYAAYEWDYEQMSSPEFSSDHEILLYGTMENQVYELKAVYLGTEAYDGNGIYDVLSKTLTEYKSNSPIYLDWSH
jgi:hypothetical protein